MNEVRGPNVKSYCLNKKADQNKQARTVYARQATHHDGREQLHVCVVLLACMDSMNAANRERGGKSCNIQGPRESAMVVGAAPLSV